MSQFIVNRSCDMCRNIEKGLVEMTVDRVRHYLCYECMTKFAIDVMEYTRQNLTDEFKSYMEEIGYKPNY